MKARTSALLPLAALAAGLIVLRRRPSFDVAGRTAVVTGGSRGLGLALARLLVARGARVAICARDREQVNRAGEDLQARTKQDVAGRVLARPCDVTVPGEVCRFFDEVKAWGGPVDLLINNAGIITVGPQQVMTDEDYRASLDTHFWAPLRCMQHVLPSMLARETGRIINIASIGGTVPVPHLAPYCAGKHALVGLSDTFAAELRSRGVIVTTVCPGLMRTGSHRNARFKGEREKEYALFSIANANPFLSMNAESAARKILRAAERGRNRLTFVWNAKLAEACHHLVPEVGLRLLAGAAAALPGPGVGSTESRLGLESESFLSPSMFTSLADRAAVTYNEF